MIISASRRTDIPACYSDWFFNRLIAGFVDVRNPMNPRQVSRIRLSPDTVDGFVFWSKNPGPMIERLDALSGYAFYFLFTLTAYGADLEPGLPDKDRILVPLFRQLARMLGPDRVVWRYDPILISPEYPPERHRARFAQLAEALEGSTRTCIISFVDEYRHLVRRLRDAGLTGLAVDRQLALACELADAARVHGMTVSTCAEPLDFTSCGIGPASCIDADRFERLLGAPLRRTGGKPLRPGCGCLPSIDIGAYDTCRIGCRYCYAQRSDPSPTEAMQTPGKLAATEPDRRHDPESSLLFGRIGPEDIIHERHMVSLRL